MIWTGLDLDLRINIGWRESYVAKDDLGVTKKAYTTPSLTALGSVRSLTQQQKSGAFDDSPFPNRRGPS